MYEDPQTPFAIVILWLWIKIEPNLQDHYTTSLLYISPLFKCVDEGHEWLKGDER